MFYLPFNSAGSSKYLILLEVGGITGFTNKHEKLMHPRLDVGVCMALLDDFDLGLADKTLELSVSELDEAPVAWLIAVVVEKGLAVRHYC